MLPPRQSHAKKQAPSCTGQALPGRTDERINAQTMPKMPRQSGRSAREAAAAAEA
jgi:hypothetical protein